MSRYQLDVFDKAREIYSVEGLPFLNEMRQQLIDNPRYRGLRILNNMPLTLATAFKIELLALGGAEVVASPIRLLSAEARAVELLQAAGITVVTDHVFGGAFDFHLDCCAELVTLPAPRAGAVELTQTGSEIYRNSALDYPIVSVDDSQLKIIETFFGTGDGFLRALQSFTGNEMYNKPYVIFGYGKVSRGIIYVLRQFTDDITIIDIKPPTSASGLRFIAAKDKEAIKTVLAKSYATVTATGIKNLLTHYYDFHKTDFGNSLLINMGADDEFGDNFLDGDVLFDKKPINFSLIEPTAFRYLDPIFYAHNLAVDLILDKKIAIGYNPFPASIAQAILQRWQALHQEQINEALQASFD